MPDQGDGPTRFAVVGTGWRSRFFLRLAAAAPDRLQATGVLTRSAARAAQVQAQEGVPAHQSLDDLLRAGPDVVIASVPRAVTPSVVRELVAAGARVLAETPPAPDLDGLRSLWADVGGSGQVQVAEQYLLMPGHAARLALVREGVVGAPTSVQLSSTHDYHAVSLVRGLLRLGGEPVTVTARAFTAPLADPLTPDGWREDPAPRPMTTTLALLDAGDGRHALYDFTDNQWWNPLRARRIVVRGSLGEISDDTVVRLVAPDAPVTSALTYRRLGVDLNLEGVDLDHVSFDGRVVVRNAWRGTRLSEDDVAVAELLARTGAWARGEGEEPYPLAQGCQDHAIALAIDEAARTGADVRVADEPWAAGLAAPGEQVQRVPGGPVGAEG